MSIKVEIDEFVLDVDRSNGNLIVSIFAPTVSDRPLGYCYEKDDELCWHSHEQLAWNDPVCKHLQRVIAHVWGNWQGLLILGLHGTGCDRTIQSDQSLT